jgi:peptidyl-prolyl cis-trans isomerase B (cyclophilin B)
VASSKDRQRKLARAKLDRQMARRAVKERRRRRMYAGIGSGVAVLLIVAGIAWMNGAFDSDKSTTAADQDICAWTPQSATTNTNLKEVGTPPTKNIPVTGTETMTIKTDQGDPIQVSLDLTTAPCGSEDLRYLASKNFFDKTTCHEITTYGAIRCGDPTGTGLGGPTYSVYSENTPAAPEPSPSAAAGKAPLTNPLYPKGTVALIGNPPGTNGSQFLIFFKDYSPASPEYSIVGSVSGGMSTVDKIGKIPTVANDAGDKVKPTTKITIASLTVAQPAASTAASAAPSASAQS